MFLSPYTVFRKKTTTSNWDPGGAVRVRAWFVRSIFNLPLSPAQSITNPAGFELKAVMCQEKCVVGCNSDGVKNVRETGCF